MTRLHAELRTRSFILSYDLLDDKRIDDVTANHLFFYFIIYHLQILCCCGLSRDRSQTSKYGKNICDIQLRFICQFLVLNKHDVICDLLRNIRTVKWDLFVKQYKAQTHVI